MSDKDVRALFDRLFPRPMGLRVPGNIDTSKRKVINNPDGSYSTVNTYGFTNDDGSAINLPGVNDTRQLSAQEAIGQYRKTGKHLGVYDTVQQANDAAQWLHMEQEQRGGGRGNKGGSIK